MVMVTVMVEVVVEEDDEEKECGAVLWQFGKGIDGVDILSCKFVVVAGEQTTSRHVRRTKMFQRTKGKMKNDIVISLTVVMVVVEVLKMVALVVVGVVMGSWRGVRTPKYNSYSAHNEHFYLGEF